jgi:putative two-component system response regulator
MNTDIESIKNNFQGFETMGRDDSGILNEEIIDVVQRMAFLAEYRKANISSHLKRIKGYCFVLATGMGLSSTDARIIAYASQLHDIGEIELPDSLVSKSGQFTPYEWEQIKRHPFTGANILRGAPSVILQMAEVIALTHHERWDGSGYPRGLKGEEIPLGGRICGLADVFDALTTKRPYKAEIAVNDALKMIQEASGKYFDPVLVDLLAENFDRIIEIRKLNI